MPRLAAACFCLCLAATACGGPPTPAAQAGDDGAFMASVLAVSQDLGPVDPNQVIPAVVELAEASASRRAHDLASLTAPGSPAFGRVLDAQSYARDYGPDPEVVSQVRRWLASAGFDIQPEPGVASLIASGSAATIDETFKVDLHQFLAPSGVRFYASRRDPAVPAALRGLVTGVDRISSYHPARITRAVPAGGVSPAALELAYDLKPLRDAGLDGAGEAVVIFGTDGHDQSDLDAFTSRFALPPIQVTEKFNPGVKPRKGGEEEMDIEVIHEVAPAARILIYTPEQESEAGLTATVDAMTQDNPGAIQSHSWGFCERAWGTAAAQHWLGTMQKAAQMGETVYVASGDRGGFECPPNDWSQPPSADWVGLGIPDAIPYVTSVGGTRLSLAEDGSWYDETVWVDAARNTGSTGGVSHYYKAGAWQVGPGTRNQFANGNRMEPDVAADSDPVSGLALRVQGTWAQGGGTSQAAPLWAGMTALINQYLKKNGQKSAGFISPALYAIAAGNPPYPPFHDVTIGGTMNFPATPGYDLATGLGTPDAWNLARDLETYAKNGGKL